LFNHTTDFFNGLLGAFLTSPLQIQWVKDEILGELPLPEVWVSDEIITNKLKDNPQTDRSPGE